MASLYFTEEHEIFRDSVRQFITKEALPHAEEWEKTGQIPRKIWEKMGELGYLGLCHSEKYGGTEADFFFSIVFLEELSRSGMGGFSAAFSVHEYMATNHIAHAGSEALKQKYLVPAIQGKMIGALGVTEPNAGSDVAAIQTKAVRDGEDYVINGSKMFITNGASADFITLLAKTADTGTSGMSLFVVDTKSPGFTAKALNKMGLHSSDTAEIGLDNVRVPASNLIGQENSGFYYIMESFQLERLVAAALAVGGMDACMEMTLKYVSERQAFGRTVSKFQTIRHTLADLATQIEAARQLTYHTAWRHAQGQVVVKECSMAKLYCTELAKKVVDECFQCFGGYAFMEEYPIARAYRDTRIGTVVGGTSAIMREIIAKMMFDQVKYSSSYKEPKTQSTSTKPAAPATASKETAPKPATSVPTATPAAAEVSAAKPTETVKSTVPSTIPELFEHLPSRFRKEKSKGVSMVIHFKITGAQAGDYTLNIQNEQCGVEQGLKGEAKCVVSVSGETFLDIELGKMQAEAAFMMGKLQVSDLPTMMQFVGLFRKIDAKAVPAAAAPKVSPASPAPVAKPAERPLPENVKQLFEGLPERLLVEKAKDVQLTVHFNLTGNNGGKFTVTLDKGNCQVQADFKGDASCVVETTADTFMDIELGRKQPENAFMMGQLVVSNISTMMKFSSLFRKF
ncbi:acyl-CoA dehydrogenase family protein [Deltaproteobacteria bacterium TL4]